MSFKRIEVSGFKSFADKLNINFDKGVTAIVGPNGCGKSNVADAIRWVLGEQSAKNLRGSNMQDVIFKGSETRKALSFCEVSLVFDNTDHTFNTEYDEVVLTRKLFRNGDREYALNRTPCLLKDITNLLHDSGIGRSGYSIIGQGKVEEIISSKPENRRAIFEEAAGIAKFKERKEESERKLERTRENITRMQDIMTEIERQLGPLKKQAENARAYLSLKEELKSFEINNYIYHHETANEVKLSIQNKIDGLNEAVAVKTAQITDCNDRHTKSMEGIKEIDVQVKELNDKILTLTIELEKQAGDQRVANEKINYMKEQISRITAELESEKSDFESINTQLSVKQEEKQAIQVSLNSLKVKIDEIQSIYIKIVEELRAVDSENDSSQQKIYDEIDKISDIKAKASRLEAELDAIFEHQDELNERKEIAEKKLEEISKSKNSAQSLRDEKEAERKAIWDKMSALKENKAQLIVSVRDIQFKLTDCQNKLTSLKSREKLLNEMHTEYEGFNGTVRRLLVDCSKDSNLKKNIVGVVAELIKVPTKFETAIEMALGSGVQNVVTNNEDDAKKLVSYLKTKSYGRATFLPINSLKPRFVPNQYLDVLKQEGCFGVACDIIQFDPKLAPVFKGLLGSTIIVENMDVAVAIGRKTNFSLKIVTLDGDVINPAGSITGGSKKAEINNLLSREREIETIGNKIKDCETELTNTANSLQAHQAKIDELTKQVEESITELHDCDVELSNKQTIFDAETKRALEISNELDLINEEIEKFLTKKEYIETEIKNIKLLQQNSGITAQNGGSVRTQRNEQLRAQRDSLSEQLTELKVSVATKESEISSLEAEITRLLGEQSSLNESIDENNSLLAKNTQILQTAMQLQQSGDVEKQSADEKKVEAIRQKIAELEQTKEKFHALLDVIAEEKDRISAELTKMQEKVYQEEAKLGQIDTNIETMKDKIFEDYQLTYNTALAFKVENYDNVAGQKRISELKKSINALGYVNVNAIEDSKVLDERYQEYTTGMEDLTKTEADIMAIIKELSEKMTTRFETEFNKINANFSRIFRELFGGGNARLILTDSDDILTAGVEIIAEPPGKKLQTLTLLSGGEKALTAIAILFAILKLRPMPFCLLDEIEAALDDANVERFAKYLHNFAEDTQFIVITHRKPTMELADSLFGVTMEEKGVSKIVSIKLSDAIKATE